MDLTQDPENSHHGDPTNTTLHCMQSSYYRDYHIKIPCGDDTANSLHLPVSEEKISTLKSYECPSGSKLNTSLRFFLIVRSPLADDSHWHDVEALSRGWRKSNPFHGVRIAYVVLILIIPAIGAQNQVIVRAYHNWLVF